MIDHGNGLRPDYLFQNKITTSLRRYPLFHPDQLAETKVESKILAWFTWLKGSKIEMIDFSPTGCCVGFLSDNLRVDEMRRDGARS
jgi:hypothetical protein